MTKLTLLGTSCMVPTKERNVSGNYIEFQGEGLLFDCGEGTQRQMNIAGINRNSVKHIFLSHWHADHVAGILGLIQTIGNKESNPTLHIYGPKETKKRVDHLMAATIFDQQVDLQIHEFEDLQEPTVICDEKKYQVLAISLHHGVPCLGFKFIEKDRRRMLLTQLKKRGIEPGPVLSELQEGRDIEHNGEVVKADDVTKIVEGKSIAYIADTHFCQQAVDIAKDATVLLCEATYTLDHEANADKHNHLTSQQAGQIAAMANCEKLVLTHLSQRYKNPADILEQAQVIFDNVELGFDFMSVKL